MTTPILLGIDAGGTKTECVALRVGDGCGSVALGPGSNYQSTGIAAAEATWRELIGRCAAELGATGPQAVAAAGLGIAGFDRPKDEAAIRSAFQRIFPHAPPMELVNDAYLVLRAGTDDGIGVAVISGTGCNAMGTAPDGRRFRVGGIGPEFGYLGSASDIGVEALRAAFRSQDDRGPQTALVEMLVSRLALDRLDDLVDWFIADEAPPEEAGEKAFHTGMLAPLVFEAAAAGDPVSIAILEWAGRELGLSTRAVARNLFARDAAFPLVMGGSVLQKGRTGHLREALIADVCNEFPRVEPRVLGVRPAAGALLYAWDRFRAASPGNDLEPIRTRVQRFVGGMQ
jgi:N-acetylglucosamine kinase-like BadF-type ATPase